MGALLRNGPVLVVLSCSLLTGCGGAQTGGGNPELGPAPPPRQRSAQVEAPRREPILVTALVSREKSLLRVDVQGIGRGHDAGEEFEAPREWVVDAFDGDGAELKRLVVGPGRVERQPVGDTGAWDVSVTFAVYFKPPVTGRTDNISLRIVPPGAPAPSTFQLSARLDLR